MAFSIEISEEAGVRTLHFGSDWIQGAMRIARPWNLELEYTREMMASLLLRDAPRKVLLIGLGAASLTKFLYRHYPLAHLTVVEIEPAVVAAARQFFQAAGGSETHSSGNRRRCGIYAQLQQGIRPDPGGRLRRERAHRRAADAAVLLGLSRASER